VAIIGLLCSGAAAAGTTLAFVTSADARLGYYALLASGSTARFLALASCGCLLGVASVVRSRGRHWSGWLVVIVGAASTVVNAALTVPVFVAARSLGQPISVHEALFRSDTPATIQPEVVTYSAGDEWQLQADLYRPEEAPAGAVVVVHGGAWRGGDKGENVASNQWLANVHGYVVLDIQYRLAPAANWQQQVLDVQNAVAWLRSHAIELHIDPERIALLGRSAGGHVALLAAYAWHPSDGPPPAGVIAVYPPTDLARLDEESPYDLRDALTAVLGGPASTMPEASPINLVRPDLPPTLLIHGAWDELVSVEQSERLAKTLEQAGAAVQLVRIPFARHAFDIVPDSPASQLARGAAATFLRQTLVSDGAGSR
jgi:acetyl esterase/lipase